MPAQSSSSQHMIPPTQFSHQYPLIPNSPPTPPTQRPLTKKQLKNQRRQQTRDQHRPQQQPLEQQQHQRQQPKKNKKKRPARGGRPNERLAKECRFYNTSTGCVTGDNCPFRHIDL